MSYDDKGTTIKEQRMSNGREVVHGQTEHIGMPNYSSISILASAKLIVLPGQEQTADDHLTNLVNGFIQHRAEQIFISLQAWATGAPVGVAPAFDPVVFDLSALCSGESELTFSMTEKIGLPNYSNITILSSHKQKVQPGHEAPGFVALADHVQTQMAKRRGIVAQNPRPWTEAS